MRCLRCGASGAVRGALGRACRLYLIFSNKVLQTASVGLLRLSAPAIALTAPVLLALVVYTAYAETEVRRPPARALRCGAE